MSTITQSSESGTLDVKNTPESADTPLLGKAQTDLALAVALQRTEWVDLRSTSGIVLEYINYRDPNSGKSTLLVAFGLTDGDVIGDNATGKITINGLDVDEIVSIVASSQEKEKTVPLPTIEDATGETEEK